MSFKILKDIVLVNIKKNWVMILSFFIFLIISLSMFFGMTSYIIGFRTQLPSQTFQTQKFISKYDTWNIGTQAGTQGINGNNYTDANWTNPIVVTNDVINHMVDEINSFKINIDGFSLTADQVRDFCTGLTNFEGGVLPSFVNSTDADAYLKYEQEQQRPINKDNFNNWFDKLEDNLEQATGILNLTSYAISQNYLSKDSRYTNKFSYGFSSPEYINLGPTHQKQIHVTPKAYEDASTRIDSGIYSNPEYKSKDNILFVSKNVEDEQHYKLGQKVVVQLFDYMSNNNYPATFTYGGTAIYPEDSMVQVVRPNNYFYFINNYVAPANDPNHELDLVRKLTTISQVHFNFRDPNSHLGKSEQREYWYNQAIASGWLNEGSDLNGWGTITDIYTLNIIYTAMYSLTIALDIIMMVLDIVIAWFLIKEIIRSLSREILFLKTLGMSNTEASLITSFSLLIILGVALGLSLVGMLGIQALFINLTNRFVIIDSIWSNIQPYSLIAIFGAIAFLLVAYYVLSVFLIKKLHVNSNDTTPKSEYRFASFRNFLFTRNINSGITFSFSIKNFNRIITTFVITLLISCLSFIALGFKDSITKGQNEMSAFNFNKDNSSFIKGWKFINSSTLPKDDKDSDQSVDGLIDYNSDKLSKDEELSLKDYKSLNDILSNDPSTKFVYVNDLDEWLKGNNKMIPDKTYKKFKQSVDDYKDKIKQIWPNADTNFVLDFGTLYYGESIAQESYQFNNVSPTGYHEMNMVLLNENDSRYKKVFGNDNANSFNSDAGTAYDENLKENVTMPSIDAVISSREAQNCEISLNTYSSFNNNYIPSIDFGYINGWVPANVWPANDRLSVHYTKFSDAIPDKADIYVKEKDFYRWISWMKTNDDKDKSLESSSVLMNKLMENHNNKKAYNNFLNDGVPLSLQQIVVPKYSLYDDKNQGLSLPLPQSGWNKNTNLLEYLYNASDALNNAGYTLYKFEIKAATTLLDPLMTTMVVILVLALVLVLTFTVFIIMTILNENDSIIFIMKALGYSKSEILWRMISGYLISVIVSLVIGTIIAAVILSAISPLFGKIIFMKVALYASGSILGLFFALIVAMFAIILGISSNGISKRNLTVREE